MPGPKIEEYTILLRMIAEADPKGFEQAKELIKDLHRTGTALKDKIEAVNRFIRGAYGYTGRDIARAMKEREEQVKKAATAELAIGKIDP